MPEYRALREIRKALAPTPPEREPEQPDLTPLYEFARDNPDPATWTNAELRMALIRLIRIELRSRRLLG